MSVAVAAGRRATTAGRRVAGLLLSRVLVVLGAVTVAFLVSHVLPGNPVAATLGAMPSTPEIVAEARAQLGVGRPLWQQYLEFLGHFATGDLGRSYQLDAPVTEVVGAQLGATVILAGTALVLGLALAVTGAMLTAGGGRRWRRAVAQAAELTVASTPGMWLGILLLTAFSFRWRVFPVTGDDGVRSLVLPAVTLALPIAAVLGQLLRSELDHALDQPFAITARAQGLREGAVRWRHALRHALLPVATLTGWMVGSLLTGAVLVETIFGRPGIGRITAQAVIGGDLPVVQGVVLLSAVVFVLVSTVVELLYIAIDPRLRRPA